ncbi:mechanosensitive ion channel family protein [Mumia sp. DW29H23]|uniref:mechanosensitive ion channel family protein n=1 Tax=Mumia sp. DW29H23 TaxID=3421241 RepID=UPI003D686902
MQDFLANLGGGSLTWSDVALALLTLLVAWLVARYLGRGVRRLLSRVQGLSPWITDSAERGTRYFVLVLGFGVALAFLGANVQPLLAGALIVVVVAALALRGVADNFGASIILQTRRPVVVGEELESQDWHGVVTAMNGRSVVIRTFDGREAHLPNSEVLANPLVNYSRSPGRRLEVEVRIAGTRDDDALLDAVRSVEGFLADPPPTVVVVSREAERTTVLVRFWHASTGSPKAVSDAIDALAATLHGRSEPWVVVSPPPETLRVPQTDV